MFGIMKPQFLVSLVLLAASASASASAQDRTAELLGKIADAPGPSGFEEPIRKVMVDAMKPYASSMRFDGMGSIIATQGTQGPRVMVDAHMDELGGMIRRITPNGLLTMQMLGGWLDQALVDQRWIILGSKGSVRAITGIRDIHLMPADERTRVFPRDMIFLAVGAKNADDVRNMGVEPGLFLFDSHDLPNRKLVQFVNSTAASRKVPLQLDLVVGYGDDSSEIQKSNGGVPTVNIVVPVRYTHAHNGIINRRDFDQMVELLVAMLQSLDAQTVQRIRDFTPE